MANRPATLRQSDATRLFKAARAAGYDRAELTVYSDGTIKISGANGPAPEKSEPLSPFEAWKASNEDTN